MSVTLRLRKLLVASHLGVTVAQFDQEVELRNVTEDDSGFDADWVVTPLGRRYLEQLVAAGVTVAMVEA